MKKDKSIFFPYFFIFIIWVLLTNVFYRGVQNRTNPIKKPQTELTQTAKNRIWFGSIQVTFVLNRMV